MNYDYDEVIYYTRRNNKVIRLEIDNVKLGNSVMKKELQMLKKRLDIVEDKLDIVIKLLINDKHYNTH